MANGNNYAPLVARFTPTGSPITIGYAVTMETGGNIQHANSAGERCLGIAAVDPDSRDIMIQTSGIGYAWITAAVNAGGEISAKADGTFGPATAGHYVMGYALRTTAGAGELVPVLMCNFQKNA